MRKASVLRGCLYTVFALALLWLVLVEAHPGKDRLYADFGRWLGQNIWGDREVDAALIQRRDALDRFRSATQQTKRALYAGEVSLPDAVDRILADWRREFPNPLPGAAAADFGDGEQERLARALVEHIDNNEHLRDNQQLRERLQAQLADMIKKRPKTTPQPGLIVSMA
ncbi:MAG: hypothetical protein L0Y71_24935 [Gemmataceae bacterium]|nr:hypothetical protein [Gemmataceae bacterium]